MRAKYSRSQNIVINVSLLQAGFRANHAVDIRSKKNKTINFKLIKLITVVPTARLRQNWNNFNRKLHANFVVV